MGQKRKTAFYDAVVMEDDERALREVGRRLREWGWSVRRAHSADEMVAMVEEQWADCVLDIDMGEDRRSEGLVALERLKREFKDVYCGILTNYSEQHRRMAEKLGANYFGEKTANTDDATLGLIESMLEFHQSEATQELENRMRKLRVRKLPAGAQPRLSGDCEADPNYLAYHSLRRDPTWFEQHEGEYVAFVRGGFVSSDRDRARFLSEVRRRFPREFVFVTRVDEEECVAEVPTPFPTLDV